MPRTKAPKAAPTAADPSRRVPPDLNLWLRDNEGLVWTAIHRHRNPILLPLDEAFSAGLLGVAKAAESYDPARGSWNTHVSWQIRGTVTAANLAAQRYRRWKREAGQQAREEFAALLAEQLRGHGRFEDGPDTRLVEKLRWALGRIPARQREVLVKRFGLDGTEPIGLKEIGRELGVSKERVRQIQIQGLERLRRYLAGTLAEIEAEAAEVA